jgi:hypothetical protein
MNVTTINSRVIKTIPVKWRDLEFIQQENFKEWINDGDTKLIESILKFQFVDPFKVWESDGKLYCLDGKHRFLDLLQVSELGHNVPDELPATFIHCENIESAAELVLVYSSAYARITQQGLFDFVSTFNLDIPSLKDVINIPEFSMERFEQTFDLFDVQNGEEPHVYVDDKNIIVKPGDLFQLNGHRLICGSFTHVNGNLTLNDFANESKLQNTY